MAKESKEPKYERGTYVPVENDNEVNGKISRISFEYVQEAKQACFERWNINRRNYDVYHLKQDYSHKREGQSREFLGKQYMAVEQTTQFFQQGLLDMENWFSIEYAPGVNKDEVKITKEEVKRLVERQLKKANLFPLVGDSVKTGLLAALMIVKVGGKFVPKPFYQANASFDEKEGKVVHSLKRGRKDVWQLDLQLVMAHKFFQDPTGRNNFQMNQLYMDWHQVEQLSKGENAIYDWDVVKGMPRDYAMDYENRLDDMRTQGTRYPDATVYRKQVKIQEFWGNIIDMDNGDLLHENVVWTIANDRYVIQAPTKNPYWHQKSPYVVAPLIRVPDSTLHRALMDAPSMNNMSINELYNLVVDGGMMETYGIKQFRPDWLEDDAAYSEGFYPGQSVAVNSVCPPGAKAIERVDTSSLGPESLAVLNLINQEFNQSALTNDLRMGTMPNRQVKATEVVEANNTITSVFSGIAKVVESEFIEKIVEMAWEVTLQHMNDLNESEVEALLGKDRAQQISILSPEERYAACFADSKFSVWGISRKLTKAKDFKKVTSFLQTIAASPQLMQEFTQKYNMTKLLDQIMMALDINTDQLVMTPEEQQAAQQRMVAMMQAQAAMQGGGQGGGQPGQGPNAQSQIPQEGSVASGSSNNTVESHLAQMKGGMGRAAEEVK